MAKSKSTAVDPGQLYQLDPATILADDNTRFSLKQSRIESLAQSILDRAAVLEPVEVEPLAEASNGHQYRLTTGFYRLAAVKHLNATQAAGLTIPALVRVQPSPEQRLRTQLAENMERENQSPMDVATAIQKMLAAGFERMAVREMFSRPGGRKGNKTQPASNSFINIHLGMLDLPKAMQVKIHEGLVGVAAAYELTKVPAERRAEVLERAEAMRQRDLEREEKDEQRILDDEKKAAERNKARKALAAAAKTASDAATASNQAYEEIKDKTAQFYTASIGKHPDAKAKKEAKSAFVKSEKARTVAEADAIKAQQEADAAQMKLTDYDTKQAARRQQLADARAKAPKGAAKKGEAVGPSDVKKAAKEAGATSTAVALNKQEIVKVVAALCLPGGVPKVIQIGTALGQCFAGEITEKQLYSALKEIVA
jgi:hypothetical protein